MQAAPLLRMLLDDIGRLWKSPFKSIVKPQSYSIKVSTNLKH